MFTTGVGDLSDFAQALRPLLAAYNRHLTLQAVVDAPKFNRAVKSLAAEAANLRKSGADVSDMSTALLRIANARHCHTRGVVGYVYALLAVNACPGTCDSAQAHSLRTALIRSQEYACINDAARQGLCAELAEVCGQSPQCACRRTVLKLLVTEGVKKDVPTDVHLLAQV